VKVVLIGFRATGKTAVGKAIAAQFNIPFFDTDSAIEKA
jgi:shikimate kinase